MSFACESAFTVYRPYLMLLSRPLLSISIIPRSRSVSASDYRGFFVSGTGAGSPLGTGLANYSNQGFFTAGTNIDSNGGGYPSPPSNASGMQITVVLAGAVENAAGKTIPGSGSLEIFKGPVADSRNPSQSDPLSRCLRTAHSTNS